MTPNRKKIAVILNLNAPGVTKKVINRIASRIPMENIYPTKDIVEARSAVSDILENSFDFIFCGGGDGTIVNTITDIRDIEREKALSPQGHAINDYADNEMAVPSLGILKMGTGNAWAWAVGVKGGLNQFNTVVEGGDYSISRYHLIEVGGRLCPFAGLGWDAQVLNDYYEVNERLYHTPLRGFMGSLYGYLFTSFTRTIPRIIKKKGATEVEITFTGRKLFKPTRNSGYLPITDSRNSIIYHGPANMVSAGMIPFFGYGFRAFPYAEQIRDTMHLRISNLDIFRTVKNIRKIWAGRYESPDFTDFLADMIRLRFDREMPLEIGGDPAGYTSEVELRVSDFQVNIVTFDGN